MKIIEKTSNRLVLQDKPSSWAIIPSSIVFLIGIILLFFNARNARVEIITCQRIEPTQVNCKLSQSYLFGKNKETLLNHVRETKAEIIESEDGDINYNITLLTKSSDICCFSTDNPSHTHQINNFLRNPQEIHLKLQHDHYIEDIFLLFLGSMFLFSGLSRMWEAFTDKIYTFDKTVGTLIQRRKSLLGVNVTEYPIKKITDVIFEEKDDEGVTYYYISLALVEGKRLRLSYSLSYSLSSIWSKENKERKIANTIAQFLDLSIKVKSEP